MFTKPEKDFEIFGEFKNKLCPELKNIILKHGIKTINPYGHFGKGADIVFTFLTTPILSMEFLGIALKNLKRDLRFSNNGKLNPAGEEIQSFIYKKAEEILDQEEEKNESLTSQNMQQA